MIEHPLQSGALILFKKGVAQYFFKAKNPFPIRSSLAYGLKTRSRNPGAPAVNGAVLTRGAYPQQDLSGLMGRGARPGLIQLPGGHSAVQAPSMDVTLLARDRSNLIEPQTLI